jgi:hypothetical protein
MCIRWPCVWVLRLKMYNMEKTPTKRNDPYGKLGTTTIPD